MNAICIYHEPQECGEHFLTFISQETGKVVETVVLPYGYYNTGTQYKTIYKKVAEVVEHHSCAPKPTVENSHISHWYGYDARKYKFIVSKVEITDVTYMGEFTIYDADIYADVCLRTSQACFCAAEDTFKQEMSALGFNMKGWCVYKRNKTNFMDFLKAVTSSYKDYNVINVIKIG